LTIEPISDDYYDDSGLHNFLSSNLTAYYGTHSPVFYWTDYGSAPYIYMLNAGNLWAYNTQTGQTDATVFSSSSLYRFSVSENNHYLVSMTLDPIALHFIDLNNPVNNKPLSNLSTLINSASVSNIGTGVVVADNVAILYDYLNEKTLGKIKLTSAPIVINKISPSGHYFVEQTNSGYEFFTFNDNQIQRLPGLQPEGEEILYVDYLPGNPERMVIATTNFIELIDCDSWKVISKLTTGKPNNIVFNLDYSSRNLFFCTSDNFVLMNVETGHTDIISKAPSDHRLHWIDLIYLNNQIFWSEGKKSTVK
jgi:hypothetical protein